MIIKLIIVMATLPSLMMTFITNQKIHHVERIIDETYWKDQWMQYKSSFYWSDQLIQYKKVLYWSDQ